MARRSPEKTVAQWVRRSAIEQARAFAAAAPGGPSLKAFQDVMPLWTKGGALEIEVKEQTDTTFTFNVVRCRYAETYKAMGLGEIGHLLSCNRTALFRGLRSQAQAERSQTIMQGPATATSSTATRTERRRARASPDGREAFIVASIAKNWIGRSDDGANGGSGVALLWPYFDFACEAPSPPCLWRLSPVFGRRQRLPRPSCRWAHRPASGQSAPSKAPTHRPTGRLPARCRRSSPIRRTPTRCISGDQWRRLGDTQWRRELDAAQRHQRSLSIASLAFDPGNPSVLIAGTGITSNGFIGGSGDVAGRGGPRIGILYSTSGGPPGRAGRRDAGGQEHRRRGGTQINQSRAAAEPWDASAAGGLFRSVNTGASFAPVTLGSGGGTVAVTALAADPSNQSVFYAAVNSTVAGDRGVYFGSSAGANSSKGLDLGSGQIARLATGPGGSVVAGIYDSTNDGLVGLELSGGGAAGRRSISPFPTRIDRTGEHQPRAGHRQDQPEHRLRRRHPQQRRVHPLGLSRRAEQRQQLGHPDADR